MDPIIIRESVRRRHIRWDRAGIAPSRIESLMRSTLAAHPAPVGALRLNPTVVPRPSHTAEVRQSSFSTVTADCSSALNASEGSK